MSTDKPKAPVVYESVSRPVLETLDPADAVKFLRDREMYEAEIAERAAADGEQRTPASYRLSVTPVFLQSVHGMGCFDHCAPGVAVTDLTDDHIKAVISDIAKNHQATEPNASMIDEALKGLRTKMSIIDPRARVYQLGLEYDTRMADIGYESFRENNPKKAIELLTDCLYPIPLRLKIKSDLEFIPTIRKDWKAFLVHVAKQAEHVQVGLDSAARANKSTASQDTRSDGKHANRNRRAADGKKKKQHAGSSKDNEEKDLPPCLNEECTERHYLYSCKNTSAEKKKELIKAYREAKKAQKSSAKAVRTEQEHDKSRQSTLFRACFAQKAESTVCTDIGSDINLLPPSVLADLQSMGAEMTVVKLPKARSFGLAVEKNSDGQKVFIVCDKVVTLNVQLFIRHGTTLWLRNISFYVATQHVPEPLIGRPLLYALGLDAEDTLAAASIAHQGSVDVSRLTKAPSELPSGSVARVISEQGMFHHSSSIEDAAYDMVQDTEFGEDTKADIDDAFDNLVSSATENGCPDPPALRGLLEKHRSVFRCKLGNDPPALVEPMKIELLPESKGILAKPRQYSMEQRRAISTFMDRAMEYDFFRRNTEASWSAAPLLVPKPYSTEATPAYRLAFDLRAVNARTVPIAWPLPHVDSELVELRGKKCFCLIDFISSYWQLPLHTASQHLHSVVTPVGILAPTRTLQGGRNSAANFQSRVEPCFAEIRDSLKAWLDDFILHARDWNDLLHILDRFLTICAEKRLLVSAKKSCLYTTSVKWCGRIIDEHGTRMDPRNLEGISNSSDPETADELSQFVNCAQWMSSCIPDFSARVKPLRDILEIAYARVGKRTSKAISRVKLSDIAWGSEHTLTMRSLQESLKNAVSLSHFDPEKPLCIYTDASDEHWAAVVTQCDGEDLGKEPDQQQHSPLAFLGAEFKDASRNWSTIEKEGFAIYSVFRKMDYLLMGSVDTHVFTDHRNLLYVFHPTAIEPGLGRHVISKLQRWALFLSQFAYHIEHVRGEKNIMADMMTRWYRGYRGKRAPPMARRVTTRASEQSESQRTDDWPTREEIRHAQLNRGAEQPPANSVLTGDVHCVNGRLWIPNNAHELHMRILVLSHCGRNGHRGADATASIVKEQYTWDSLKDDCREFIDQCLHCLTASSGEKIPRPLSATVHGDRPNSVLHFDFLFMGQSTEELQYVLLLKDDFSSYCWIVPCQKACAEEAAKAIASWIRTFSVMGVWVSDQGSHFKNELLQSLAADHGIKHKFTIAYSPWANGTVERLCREVLRTTRSFLSENKFAESDWPAVIHSVQTAVNEAPVRRLGSRPDGTLRTPLEVMTGIRPQRGAGNTVFTQNTQPSIGEISKLQEALHTMQKDVQERSSKERQRMRDAHNKKTNIQETSFSLGDFVMVRRSSKKGHKLANKWVGPRRVVEIISHSAYVVQNLITEKRDTVHYTRLRFVSSASDADADSFQKHAEHTESIYDTVEALLSTKLHEDQLYAHVRWANDDSEDDCTWQPFKELCEDIPDLVQQYVNSSNDHLAQEALELHNRDNGQTGVLSEN